MSAVLLLSAPATAPAPSGSLHFPGSLLPRRAREATEGALAPPLAPGRVNACAGTDAPCHGGRDHGHGNGGGPGSDTDTEQEPPPGDGQAKPRFVEVLRDHAPAYLLAHHLGEQETRVLERLLQCRTPGLGGKLAVCKDCGDRTLVCNACRERHCPTCPAVRQWRWSDQRKKRALDVPHFHTVFTVPAELRPLFLADPRRLYGALMAAAAQTVRWACRRAVGDAIPAFTTVLHTWNRSLGQHPHVHVLLAAGGLAPDGSRWVEPAAAMLPADDEVRDYFRAALLRRIRRLRATGELRRPDGWGQERLEQVLERAAARRWYVYSKGRLRSDETYEYLANYTRRVGLSSARLLSYDGETVRLGTREGRSVLLSGEELVRRFLLHVLPPRFVRLRHHGLFVSRHAKNHALARLRIAEQGLGCGFAAELEGREVEAPASAASAANAASTANAASGEAGGEGETWQELCTRRGFDVQHCRRCQGPLDYVPFPASTEMRAGFRAMLFARGRARLAASAARSPP